MFKNCVALALVVTTIAVGGTAYASDPLTISVGGDSSDADHDFVATTLTAVHIVITNSEQDVVEWGCQSAAAAGVIHGGTTSTNGSNSLHHIMSVTSTQWSNCVTFSEVPLAIIADHTSAWELTIDHDEQVTGGSSDILAGKILDMNVHVQDMIVAGALCRFDIVGSLNVSLDEGAQQLHVTGDTLELDQVNGCFGAYGDGDPVDIDTSFDLTMDAPSIGPVLIS